MTQPQWVVHREPNAIYIHCASHNLNLVLNHTCQNVSKVKEHYDTVQKWYVSFSGSIKRWQLVESQLKWQGNQHLNSCARRVGHPEMMLCAHSTFVTQMWWKHLWECVCYLKSQMRPMDSNITWNILSLSFRQWYRVKFWKLSALFHKVSKNRTLIFCRQANMYPEHLRPSCHSEESFTALKKLPKVLLSHSFPQKHTRRTKRHVDELCEDERLKCRGALQSVSMLRSSRRCWCAGNTQVSGHARAARRFGFLHPQELLLNPMVNCLHQQVL